MLNSLTQISAPDGGSLLNFRGFRQFFRLFGNFPGFGSGDRQNVSENPK